jgi:hypothetical protein
MIRVNFLFLLFSCVSGLFDNYSKWFENAEGALGLAQNLLSLPPANITSMLSDFTEIARHLRETKEEFEYYRHYIIMSVIIFLVCQLLLALGTVYTAYKITILRAILDDE